MDWKICAVDDLRRYNLMKIGILNSKDKLRTMEKAALAARQSFEEKPKHLDSKLVDLIVETERLRSNIHTAQNLVTLVDRGLGALSEGERSVLEKFYIDDCTRTTRSLREHFGYSQRSIYRIRDRALRKFTLAMYGVEIT